MNSNTYKIFNHKETRYIYGPRFRYMCSALRVVNGVSTRGKKAHWVNTLHNFVDYFEGSK